MSTDHLFSDAALALLREAPAKGLNVIAIRSALHKISGIWFRDLEIITEAARFGHELKSLGTGSRPSEPQRVAPAPLPARPEDNVGLVRPGRWPVPKGGYKIGSGTFCG
jgi:hypothetical protein